MRISNCVRSGAVAATVFVLALWVRPASAQMRGMMPMRPPTMTPPTPMPNPQVAALLALLRQREAALMLAENQVQAQINMLAMTRPTMARNATIMALQREEAILTLAIRQTAADVAALGGK